jgi:hypothetical protein
MDYQGGNSMKTSILQKITSMIFATLCLIAIGCSNSSEPEQTVQVDAPATDTTPEPVVNKTPGEAVATFLTAIREGDKYTAEHVLTKKARQQTEAVGMFIDPEADTTATFTVGEVQIEKGEAQVFATWSVAGTEDEEAIEEKMVWLLKKEDVSWQIYGLATDTSGTVLDFENPNGTVASNTKVCKPDPEPTPIPVEERRQGSPTPAIALPPQENTTTQ